MLIILFVDFIRKDCFTSKAVLILELISPQKWRTEYHNKHQALKMLILSVKQFFFFSFLSFYFHSLLLVLPLVQGFQLVLREFQGILDDNGPVPPRAIMLSIVCSSTKAVQVYFQELFYLGFILFLFFCLIYYFVTDYQNPKYQAIFMYDLYNVYLYLSSSLLYICLVKGYNLVLKY